jgi:hypothetical protein
MTKKIDNKKLKKLKKQQRRALNKLKKSKEPVDNTDEYVNDYLKVINKYENNNKIHKKIEEFLNSIPNTSTRKTRKYDLQRIKYIIDKINVNNQDEFLEEIFKSDLPEASLKSSLIAYSNFLKFMNINNDKVEDFYREFKSNYEPAKESKAKDLNLPDLVKLLPNIQNINDRLILSLYLKYPSLRSDVFYVKFRNYEENEPRFITNKIVFPETIKTKKKIIIDLDETEINLIELNIQDSNDDFIVKSTRNKNVGGAVTKEMKRITRLHLGVELSINDIRKLHINFLENSIKNMSNKEAGQARIELAKKMSHSVLSQQQSYLI